MLPAASWSGRAIVPVVAEIVRIRWPRSFRGLVERPWPATLLELAAVAGRVERPRLLDGDRAGHAVLARRRGRPAGSSRLVHVVIGIVLVQTRGQRVLAIVPVAGQVVAVGELVEVDLIVDPRVFVVVPH